MNKNSNNEENELEAIDFIENKIQDSPAKITWKHVWTFDKSQNALLNSPFIDIPTEIMLKIFGLLSIHDLGNVSLVCRSFKMIVDQDTIWKKKCNINSYLFLYLNSFENKIVSKKLYSKSYKQIYIDWTYGKYLRNKELERLLKKYRSMNISCACRMKYSPSRDFVQPIIDESFCPIFGFDQHPNSSADIIIQLSVDLDKTAHQLILLLEKASKFKKKWCKSVILQQMIRRYYRFMVLKVLYPKNFLVPTIDIEIVWQTHLLRPFIYQDDCLRLFNQIIDHSLLLNQTEQYLKEQAFLDTCHLYEKHFHEQYCSLSLDKSDKTSSSKYIDCYLKLQYLNSIYSYWDDTYFKFLPYPLNDFENPFSFAEADIILDANWISLCKEFMNIMLLKRYVDFESFNQSNLIDLKPSAMKQLKKSYERFLYITATYLSTKQDDLIYPTYAIDIMLHCHMQEPLKYANDCYHLVGYLIDHCPWPSTEKNQIKQSFQNLKRDWKREFQQNIWIDHLRSP
ncbi:unnamed protein product [Rotaria sordida]|nr:unnamed protein product [Rotaria sordida]CAF3693585.1 unnamed protein product [Rotaria sordida]CAF3740080.1 unnamed protein product [Rotaria sordida]CAF4152161.1 unnamed protein product [Rotaria sordida]